MLRRVLGRGHSSRDALGLATPVCGSLEIGKALDVVLVRTNGLHGPTDARSYRMAWMPGHGRRRHHARRGPGASASGAAD